MDDPPGTVPGPAPTQTRHPRRPPAHQSVSLRHSPPSKLQQQASNAAVRRHSTKLSTSPNALASDKANPPSSISPRLNLNNHSSGESSDAAGWFERTNNDASQGASFVDNDPPFLLHNSSSSERTPPDGQYAGMGLPSLPYRPNLLNLGTDGSRSEDFRSVIDDLTIANKKLKQKLRRYEKVYDAHLQEEKLFEVRFHGLPDHKKKELEETLRKFAAGLDDSSSDRPDIHFAPALNKEVTGSSTSRFAESGYVSMSASGQNSSTPSNGASNQNIDNRRMTKSAYNRQQQSIQSYLHDIPQGLMPQENAPMSDKARKKLVVRRLEQIFAGKSSAPGNHPQPMQQEEVAQSAATADRREREATGRGSRPEGQRTALIMPERADREGNESGFTLHIPVQQRVNEQDFAASGSGSPDQRPTRPLDLDPYRAQVPAANMEYFRHLGFSPPDMTTDTESLAGHGWIYLNLLINMAQLHTLNVTPDDVKEALTEYSTKLELSSDGRKIRWKGGHDFSKTSSVGSPEQSGVNSPYQPMTAQQSPRKSPKTGKNTSIESSGYGGFEHRSRQGAPTRQETEQSIFAYKPLFFRGDSSEEDQDFYDLTESASSMFQPQQRGDSSGLGSSVMQSNRAGKRRDDGPMIFYNKAKFCTDLTGDRVGASLTLPENYKTITSHPLGAKVNTETGNGSEFWEPRGPLEDTRMDIDSKSGTQTPSTAESLGFSPASLQNNTGTDCPDLTDFQASGLGGVQLDDNFSIRVQRSQIPTAPTDVQANRRASLYPSKIQAILAEDTRSVARRRRSTSPKIKEAMISAVREDMPSSILPPPSFFPFDSTSSGELSDDEDESSSGDYDTNDGPSTALQLLNIAPPGDRIPSDQSELSSEYSESMDDDDDDDSIDLLATARQQDPEKVRAYEREYDAAVADRQTEEIAAGSSAATAGGGSGFNSPASHAARLSKQGSARKSNRKVRDSTSEASLSPRSKNLKRARGSDSTATITRNGLKASKSQRTG